MLGTTGMSTASNTILSTVVWNISTTEAATNAVMRFTPSHRARRRALLTTGANMSSSSSSPAAPINKCSAWSRITSTISSTVIRPTSRLLSSTTGADSKSRFSNSHTTASDGVCAGMGSLSVDMASATDRFGSRVNSRDKYSEPKYSLPRLTT